MNLCVFRGNLTRDVELRKTNANNTPVCNFSLAVREFRNGEATTDFFDFEAWGSIAENLAKGGNKGRCVLVTCKAKRHDWTKKDEETGQIIQMKGNRYRVEYFEWTSFNTQPNAGREDAPPFAEDDQEEPSDNYVADVVDDAGSIRF